MTIARGGLLQLVDTLHRRADKWGRTGAVYLLADPNGNPIAGNIARWPNGFESREEWVEFEIDASEHGGVVAHPVRAHVFRLPDGMRLLVGTDILERKRARIAPALRHALGRGLVRRARGVRRASVTAAACDAASRAIAATCETIMRGDLSQRLPVEAVAR